MNTHAHHHNPEKYYLTVPFEEFPKRFGTHAHPTPRHLTLVPWFVMSAYRQAELVDGIKEVTKNIAPFHITFGEPTVFGPGGDEYAQPVVNGREQLALLHAGLLAVVSTYGWVVDTTYVGERYNPHSSIKRSDPYLEGMDISVRSVLLIAKFVKDERRMNEPDKEFSSGIRLGTAI
jgi:2'-5' RNA ligase